MFTYSDRVVELHKSGLNWHEASVQARKEYNAQFNCLNCDSTTTPGYEFDGQHEPHEDVVVQRLLKELGLKAVRTYTNF